MLSLNIVLLNELKLETYLRASSYSDRGDGFAEEGKSFHRPIRQRRTVAHIQQLQKSTLSAKHLRRDRKMSRKVFQRQIM